MKKIISLQEMAGILGVAPIWIYRHLADPEEEEKIPHIRVGRRYRFDSDEVIGWFREKHSVQCAAAGKGSE